MTKIYASDQDKWKTEYDLENERDLSRREINRLFQLDMQVDFSFNVNDVRFNSGLNADIMEALETGDEDGTTSAAEFNLL